MVKKKQTFESALERLEELVTTLEAGELSLEASLAAFKEGMELTVFCRSQLEKAEAQLQTLVKDGSGEFQLALLDK